MNAHATTVLQQLINDPTSEAIHEACRGISDPGYRMATNVSLHLVAAFNVLARHDRHAATATLDYLLERELAGLPELSGICVANPEMLEEIRIWCDWSSDAAVLAMAAECLRQIESRPDMQLNGKAARKRALVAIWNTLDAKDRTAFLEHVDPGAAAKA